MLALLEFFGELIELIDWLIKGVAGWRYLFSSAFRNQTHRRWKAEGKLRAMCEIIAGLSGIIFTLLFVGMLVYLSLA